MFGTLLESRRASRRQHGYTIVSVIAHFAIIAGAVAATASASAGPGAAPPVEVIDLAFVTPRDPAAGQVQLPGGGAAGGRTAVDIPELPQVDVLLPARRDAWPDGGVRWDPGAGIELIAGDAGGGLLTGGILGDGPVSGEVYLGADVERAAVLRTRFQPTYPGILRAAGIEGRVLVRMVVDTAGRPERGSIEIRESSHDLFTASVRAVAERLRFAPAMVGGQRVRQLVEMPFVFTLTR